MLFLPASADKAVSLNLDIEAKIEMMSTTRTHVDVG